LVFFNMLWVVIPLLLLRQSWNVLVMQGDLAASVYLPGKDAQDDAYVRNQQKLHRH